MYIFWRNGIRDRRRQRLGTTHYHSLDFEMKQTFFPPMIKKIISFILHNWTLTPPHTPSDPSAKNDFLDMYIFYNHLFKIYLKTMEGGGWFGSSLTKKRNHFNCSFETCWWNAIFDYLIFSIVKFLRYFLRFTLYPLGDSENLKTGSLLWDSQNILSPKQSDMFI